MPKYRTEVRSRWTKDSLYLLYVCPYEELYLKPDPKARCVCAVYGTTFKVVP
jgi:hypothetical protein